MFAPEGTSQETHPMAIGTQSTHPHREHRMLDRSLRAWVGMPSVTERATWSTSTPGDARICGERRGFLIHPRIRRPEEVRHAAKNG